MSFGEEGCVLIWFELCWQIMNALLSFQACSRLGQNMAFLIGPWDKEMPSGPREHPSKTGLTSTAIAHFQSDRLFIHVISHVPLELKGIKMRFPPPRPPRAHRYMEINSQWWTVTDVFRGWSRSVRWCSGGFMLHVNDPGEHMIKMLLALIVIAAVLVAQSCLTPCNPMDCSPPGSLVRGISQAWILEWVTCFLCQGILLTQGSNPGFPHCRQTLYRLSHQGSPSKTQE